MRLPWATDMVSFLGLGGGMTRKAGMPAPGGRCGPDQWQVCSLSWPGAPLCRWSPQKPGMPERCLSQCGGLAPLPADDGDPKPVRPVLGGN